MSNQPCIVIHTTEIETNTGKKGEYQTQMGVFERGDGAAFPVELFVDNGKPHAPGRYTISLKSYVPSRYGVDFKPRLGALIPAPK